MKRVLRKTTESREETCVLVGVEVRSSYPLRSTLKVPQLSSRESLNELAKLAKSAGVEVVARVIQSRKTIDPATVIGRGKVGEVKAWIAGNMADIVIFNRNLSPTQQVNLENHLDCRVIDRTQLILDIFARHARTREGRLQVELAQLQYTLPRLIGHGTTMSRLGAGIGTRGPGETKLETDRRRISLRMEKIKEHLDSVRKTRALQRKKRSNIDIETIAVVGYTNAGKSTLFNRLTSANVVADNRMFSTLDPTLRVLDLPSQRRVLLSDTVGFISHLPPTLIQAFRATLEEVIDSTMILHVVDSSSPHQIEHIHEVEKILRELGADNKEQLIVFNKNDLCDADEIEVTKQIQSTFQGKRAVAVSALHDQDFDDLLGIMDELLPKNKVGEAHYHFSYRDGEHLSFLYNNARIIKRNDGPKGVEITALAPESVRKKLTVHTVHRQPLRMNSNNTADHVRSTEVRHSNS